MYLWTVWTPSTKSNINIKINQHSLASLLFSLNMSFNQQNQVFFNLIFFSSQQFFTQHCLLSALNSINIMKHLNCFSITCLISISIVFQSHALLSVTIDFQSQLIFSQHSMISISIVFQSTLIFSQHLD